MEELELTKFSKEKTWSVLCYLPIINFITCPIAAVKVVESKDVRFHSRQGLILFALWFLSLLIALFIKLFGFMVWGIVMVLYLACLFVTLSGKKLVLPFVGQIAELIPEFYIYSILTGKSPKSEWVQKDVSTDAQNIEGESAVLNIEEKPNDDLSPKDSGGSGS